MMSWDPFAHLKLPPESDPQRGTHGEHPNGRRALDQLTRDLIETGYSPSHAKERARQVAQRHGRKK